MLLSLKIHTKELRTEFFWIPRSLNPRFMTMEERCGKYIPYECLTLKPIRALAEVEIATIERSPGAILLEDIMDVTVALLVKSDMLPIGSASRFVCLHCYIIPQALKMLGQCAKVRDHQPMYTHT